MGMGLVAWECHLPALSLTVLIGGRYPLPSPLPEERSVGLLPSLFLLWPWGTRALSLGPQA